eukprot:3611336-Rhodomonas_salina.3
MLTAAGETPSLRVGSHRGGVSVQGCSSGFATLSPPRPGDPPSGTTTLPHARPAQTSQRSDTHSEEFLFVTAVNGAIRVRCVLEPAQTAERLKQPAFLSASSRCTHATRAAGHRLLA